MKTKYEGNRHTNLLFKSNKAYVFSYINACPLQGQ